MPKPLCECADPKCPECQGNCTHEGAETLYRIDMTDESGTWLCDQCAADAMASGLFTDEPGDEDEDAEPQEPSEGDLFTEDWIKFYEVGDTSIFARKLGRGAKVEVSEGQEWQLAVLEYMEREQFWPNVWSLSDHGNWCLLSLDKEAE